MKLKTTHWVVTLGTALVVTTAGIGVAVADGLDWYTGSAASVADPLRTGTGLKLYSSTGVEVTSGTTTTPIAAFAAADGSVRTGDDHAILFVHLPQADTTPGAWPGVQATGTDKFAGTGAVTAPSGVTGKPFVRTGTGDYTVADVVAALPQTSTGASFAGVYELRLRTSSAAASVSDTYAATWIKVSGTTWSITTAPVLGGGGPVVTTPVNTTVQAAWPASITYGTAASVQVTVSAASGSAKPTGSVSLASGASTLSTGTLSAAGTATLSIPRTALLPGARALTVKYVGATGTFNASVSAAKSFTVAKARPGTVTLKVTKAPKVKAAGSATVTVPGASGLPATSGKVTVTLVKGKSTKKVTVTLKSGKATVKLPKLAKGSWKITASYAGDARYLGATSKTATVKAK